MEKPDLTLIRAARGRSSTPDRRGSLVMACAVLAAVVFATFAGADRARRPVRASDLAEQAIQEALALGSEDDKVRATVVELRESLARSPLDSKTRVLYSSLLLGLSRQVGDMPSAAFHAKRAAELAPVTLSVTRTATLVLSRTGHGEEAAELVRSMYGYEPAAAARLMARIEILGASVENALPETPEAWLAWSRQLAASGRTDEMVQQLELAHRRWPDHLPTLDWLAERAVARRDRAALEALFPPDRVIPDQPAAAVVLLRRAQLRQYRNDRDGAVADIERALRLKADSVSILLMAGDVYESLGDVGRARRQWNRALFRLPSGPGVLRERVIHRLARLEDRHGEPAAALRLWESLLELSPEHAEAQRRVDDLSGFRR